MRPRLLLLVSQNARWLEMHEERMRYSHQAAATVDGREAG